ncbi:hypothetical protein HanHA300_Chr17g0674291 [Helianthus annuus]|nr:hypothetical protein HanHA300_Chr17g0674291 [Helianthus annuus]KAJ0449349.1 hypothetical protein HanHA89_Chr17g0727481 [Helianthus annuus]KAJ0634195.1 hypothetical protein HanLR1_Chr17g0685431 [Helianthus annuus]KAJ0637999.1 hypothetical protein HanOQP8_Chr17g0680361 [Helianthus annuus]
MSKTLDNQSALLLQMQDFTGDVIQISIAHVDVSREIQADLDSHIVINSCDDHELMGNMVFISCGLQCIHVSGSISVMHWQNNLYRVTFAPSHPLRSHIHDKTWCKGLMGIIVWIGNTSCSRGGTGSRFGNGLLNTYKKVVVQSNWVYWQEGLMIIYVPPLYMKGRFMKEKSTVLKGQQQKGPLSCFI